MAPCPSPFTPQQETQIVFQFGRLGHVARVWRWFRKEFNVSPFELPSLKQFSRVIERFKTKQTTSYGKSTGCPSTGLTDENVVKS